MNSLMDFVFGRVTGGQVSLVTPDSSNGKCGENGRESPSDVHV
jgi:hypothetical protein